MSRINHERRKQYDRRHEADTPAAVVDMLGRAVGRLPVPVVVAGLRKLAQLYQARGERRHLARMTFGYRMLADRKLKPEALGVSPEQLGIGLAWLKYRRGKL